MSQERPSRNQRCRTRPSSRKLRRLTGVRDPERKRKIVGEEFIRVFEEQARRLGLVGGFLVQGTTYPDVIESGGVAGVAAVIKSHHNVGGASPTHDPRSGRAAPEPLQGRGARGRAGTRSPAGHRLAPALPRARALHGDERTYAYTIVVRAVTSEDGMTADWARLPHDLLERIASRIVSTVSQVNRVAYDVTSKPPSTIEWE